MKLTIVHHAVRFLAIGLFALLLAGCGTKINQTNFNKINNDMTQEQVEAVLGKPTETSATDLGIMSGGTCVWKSDKAIITIHFMNGKVMTKSFSETKK